MRRSATALTGIAALALLAGTLAPVTAAQAANGFVSGTVEYDDAGVGNIMVGWFKPSTGTYKVVRTEEDGSFEVRLPGAGAEYVLFANLSMKDLKQNLGTNRYVGTFYGKGDKRDYAYQVLTPYTSTGGSDTVTLDLVKPGKISGTSKLLAGRPVQLQHLGGTYIEYNGPGEEAGSGVGDFSFDRLVPGKYRLAAAPFDDEFRRYLSSTITVTSGKTTVISPKPKVGATIYGTARTSDGSPAKGVRVSATNSDGAFYATTNKNGRYELRALDPARKYRVTFGGVGTSDSRLYVEESVIVDGLKDDTKTRQNAVLVQGARLVGDIAQATSRSTTSVTLVNSAGESVIEETPYGGYGDGFTLDGIPSGTYDLTVVDTGRNRWVTKSVKLTAGTKLDLGSVSLTKVGATLTGTLTPKSGYDRSVRLTSTKKPAYLAFPDTNGTYTITGIVPGTYVLAGFAPEYEGSSTRVKVTGTTTRNITAGTKYATISGTLTSGGAPVAGVRFTAGSSSTYMDATTRADGSFTATGPGGTYRLDYFKSSRMFQTRSPYWAEFPASREKFTVNPGKDRNLGEIKLTVRG